jgi:hypothetical protein
MIITLECKETQIHVQICIPYHVITFYGIKTSRRTSMVTCYKETHLSLGLLEVRKCTVQV